MADLDIRKIVEAVLFAADSPVPLDKLADIVDEAQRSDVRKALKELADQFDSDGRPYELTEVAGGWQIYCRPEYSKWIRELHKGRIPTRLSQAALETLAIIAYKQPIVRAEIEAIRGVDSSGVLATLMRRDLITIAGRAPGMGRALMYRTTKEFLRYFGLNYVTDLPRLEEFAEVLGLKPGEIELAVEGAESVTELPDTGTRGPLSDPPAGAEAEAAVERAGDEAPTPADTDWDGADEPGYQPAEERPGARGGSPGFATHGETHAMDDRSLIDEIDEA